MQNGLLDILMSPDKYQELIQYHQAQNSIIFPSLHHAAYQIDALNPRLPTWEFLQVSFGAIGINEGDSALSSSAPFVLMTNAHSLTFGEMCARVDDV